TVKLGPEILPSRQQSPDARTKEAPARTGASRVSSCDRTVLGEPRLATGAPQDRPHAAEAHQHHRPGRGFRHRAATAAFVAAFVAQVDDVGKRRVVTLVFAHAK